jgi:erythronate-4-phosphate dehydrogenase
MKILADETLISLRHFFPKPFELTLYKSALDAKTKLLGHDILLCRSTLKVNREFLTHNNLTCVATASSGIDHIDIQVLKEHNITLFDGRGGNAHAVADYVVSVLAYLSTHKKLSGMNAGVIGIGEVGQKVVPRLQALGFNVRGSDPYQKNLKNDLQNCSIAELCDVDLLLVHANFHKTPPFPSANLIDKAILEQLKPSTIIINAARGGIINEEALITMKPNITYCTDVYSHEPSINAALVEYAYLTTPHIAGLTIEAKDNIMRILSASIHLHAGLTAPEPSILNHNPPKLRGETWQQSALCIYNPEIESSTLKKACDKSRTFLELRSAHHYRHDSTYYDMSQLSAKVRAVFG